MNTHIHHLQYIICLEGECTREISFKIQEGENECNPFVINKLRLIGKTNLGKKRKKTFTHIGSVNPLYERIYKY